MESPPWVDLFPHLHRRSQSSNTYSIWTFLGIYQLAAKIALCRAAKTVPHSSPKKRTRSKSAAKASRELQQLKRWSANETKLELTLSYAPGCAVSYIGTLGEDYKDDTFSFQPDAPPAQSSVPPMHIALDPRSWKNSAVVVLYGRSPAIFVKNGKNQIHLTIRESRFHKLLIRSPKPKSDSTALLQQLRAWARDSTTV